MKKTIIASTAFFGLIAITVTASAQTTTLSVRAQQRVTTEITRSDTEIASRISSLQELVSRVVNLRRVSTTTKSAIAASAQIEINDLTALQAKIATDSTTTLKTDLQSIVRSYRVYVLVEPQMHILASADRINTITSMMSIIEGKIQARVTTLKNAGTDTSALDALLTDISSKLADAQTQATTSVTLSAGLTPDNGATSTAVANKTALENSRAAIKTATTDLQAIRQDLMNAITMIKQLSAKPTATTTAQ